MPILQEWRRYFAHFDFMQWTYRHITKDAQQLGYRDNSGKHPISPQTLSGPLITAHDGPG